MPEDPPADTAPQAWHTRAAQSFFWAIVAVVLTVDLVSKWVAFALIPLQQPVDVLPGQIEFRTTLNEGAVFGLGAGGRWVFIAATAVAVWFILQLFAHSRPRQKFLHTLLALTLGGALGNLYDRAVYGQVRDFIHITLKIGGIQIWPWIFNVADIALVAGIGALLAGWTFGWLDVHSPSPSPRGSAVAVGGGERTDERTEHVD